MSKGVKVDDLSKEIEKALVAYSDDISELVKEVADDVGKEAVQELKNTSPKKKLCSFFVEFMRNKNINAHDMFLSPI